MAGSCLHRDDEGKLRYDIRESRISLRERANSKRIQTANEDELTRVKKDESRQIFALLGRRFRRRLLREPAQERNPLTPARPEEIARVLARRWRASLPPTGTVPRHSSAPQPPNNLVMIYVSHVYQPTSNGGPEQARRRKSHTTNVPSAAAKLQRFLNRQSANSNRVESAVQSTDGRAGSFRQFQPRNPVGC